MRAQQSRPTVPDATEVTLVVLLCLVAPACDKTTASEGTGTSTTSGGGASGTGAGGEGSGSGGASDGFVVWTQSVDDGDTLGVANEDVADAGREALYHAPSGRVYVIGYGVVEGATDIIRRGTIRAYDAATQSAIAQTQVGGPGVGKDTRLFNGVFGVDGGNEYLYVTGKTNTDVANLCPGAESFPDSAGADNSTNGVIVQLDLTTLEVVDCLAIQTAGNRFDEIASLEWDPTSNVLWIAGSTKGDVIPGSRLPGNLPGSGEASSDIYAARVTPDLDTMPLFFQFGSIEFDETLGTDFDPETQTLYIAGSTRGDLCDAYPTKSSAFGITCSHGQSGALGDNFDSYLASLTLTAPATIEHAWVYQFGEGSGLGSDDADVSHDVELFDEEQGTRYLYEAGYMPGGESADARMSRVRLDPLGRPAVIDGSVDHMAARIADPASYGDTAATLHVGEVSVWVTVTMHAGADHAHGGPCGEGPMSANEGHLMAFDHATFTHDSLPTLDFVRQLTTGPDDQRSTSFEGVAHADGRFWIAGNTNGEPGTGFCGEQTTKDTDDEADALILTLDYDSP